MGTAQQSQWISKLPRRLRSMHLSETIILCRLALLVGLTTGVGMWLFEQLIDLIHILRYSIQPVLWPAFAVKAGCVSPWRYYLDAL